MKIQYSEFHSITNWKEIKFMVIYEWGLDVTHGATGKNIEQRFFKSHEELSAFVDAYYKNREADLNKILLIARIDGFMKVEPYEVIQKVRLANI